MDIAKNAGCLLSYDPNLRLLQWPSEEAARKDFMTHGMKLTLLRRPCKLRVGSCATDCIFTSFQAERHSIPFLLFLAARNNQLTSLRNVKQEFKGKVSGVKVGAVDTTGTGDAFLNIVASDIDLFKILYRRGAIPAVPPKDAVLKVLRPGALLEKIHTSNGNATHVSMAHIVINQCHYRALGRMILVR
ncbi:fructokinase-7 [Populus alba x Populus x berolinensis]|nr:fructokinase-7 [Populus alba x Populus x berolinensis]